MDRRRLEVHEGMLGRWGVIGGEGASSPSVACGGGLHEVPLELACPAPGMMKHGRKLDGHGRALLVSTIPLPHPGTGAVPLGPASCVEQSPSFRRGSVHFGIRQLRPPDRGVRPAWPWPSGQRPGSQQHQEPLRANPCVLGSRSPPPLLACSGHAHSGPCPPAGCE